MRGGSTSRYVLASLAFGAIAVWGSEMLFWSAPTAPLGLIDLPLVLLAYSLASAAALSAVLLTRARGLPAALLGGSIMGWLVEGVVVATAYDAFPFQLVWTPLAWHGLVTGLALVGLWRWAMGSIARLLTMAVALIVFGTAWALYWPLERTTMPGLVDVALYLVWPGLLVVLGHITLDRLGNLERPAIWVLLAVPAGFALVWAIQLVLTADPRRLALPVVIAVAVLAMRGSRSPVLALGRAPHWSRHALFLLVPAGIAVAASALWSSAGGLPTNSVIAIVTSGGSLVALGWLLVRAALSRRNAG